MSCLSGASIRRRRIITPYEPRTVFHGLSYGESLAGYDVRLAHAVELIAGHTVLGVTLEHFDMPTDLLGRVHDKSTWARLGVHVQNTVIEPGWRGYLTLELTYLPLVGAASLPQPGAGFPIAQIIFEELDRPVDAYRGKYQNQPQAPVGAVLE
jgi:dCTP deaminase